MNRRKQCLRLIGFSVCACIAVADVASDRASFFRALAPHQALAVCSTSEGAAPDHVEESDRDPSVTADTKPPAS